MKSKKKEIFAICVKKMGKLHVKIKMPLAAVVYYGIEKHNEDEWGLCKTENIRKKDK